MNEPFCAQLSITAGEPLAGTAVANTDRWIVLEQQAAWGPKGLEDSALPAGLVAKLSALGQRHARLRVQLFRRERSHEPALPVGAGARVYFAETGDRPALFSRQLADLEGLGELDLDGWLRGDAPAPGSLESEPLYLVCVHGKRDRCCALLGLPVYRALAACVGERVVQTTHLGGHRFAATLLALPVGLCYGRVLPEEAAALAAATARGDVFDLGRVRGRSAFPSEAQAAEVALRGQLGELRADALALERVERTSDDKFRVHFTERGSGRAHQVSLAREALPATPQSCGAASKPGKRLVVLEPAVPEV